jgi:hypothetical protein
METKVTSPAIKGIILSLILIVFSLVTIYTNQMENKALGFVPILIFAAGIIWGCINYANQMNNNVTFGNVFGHGFKITAAVVALMTIYTLLLFLLIRPELQEYSLEKAREAMEKNQNMSEGDMDNALAMTKRLMMPMMIGVIILMYGIGGCIASLIGAAVAKKNPNQTPFNQ